MKGLYFHFPYCIHKCSYCDFYSIAKSNASDEFINAVLKEIDFYSKNKNHKIDTVFFGGGTPSLLNSDQFNSIADKIYSSFDIADDYEFTVECNPGAVDMENIKLFKDRGVNRISMGIQSFNEKELEFLERIHSPEEAVNSYNIIRDAGFDNVSIDLMFAIPNQTKDILSDTLDKAIALNSEHISAYSLIYEPGTPMYYKYKKGEIKPLEQDLDTDLYELLVEKLTDAGFEQYEVSNYAKNGKMCRHNLKYWHSEEYFGLGPSAHGFLDGKRFWNIRSIKKYIDKLQNDEMPVEGFEILTKDDIMAEQIFLALRADGLNLPEFDKKFKFNKEIFYKLINEFIDQKLLDITDNIAKLSNKGYFLGDEISVKILKSL